MHGELLRQVVAVLATLYKALIFIAGRYQPYT